MRGLLSQDDRDQLLMDSLIELSSSGWDSCHASMLGMLYRSMPSAAARCLNPCQSSCPALNGVINAYLTKGGQPAARRSICRNRYALRCLVDHIGNCWEIVNKAKAYGMYLPTNRA